MVMDICAGEVVFARKLNSSKRTGFWRRLAAVPASESKRKDLLCGHEAGYIGTLRPVLMVEQSQSAGSPGGKATFRTHKGKQRFSLIPLVSPFSALKSSSQPEKIVKALRKKQCPSTTKA